MPDGSELSAITHDLKRGGEEEEGEKIRRKKDVLTGEGIKRGLAVC